MDLLQARDLSKNQGYFPNNTDAFRVAAGQTYQVGALLKLPPLDSQYYVDYSTLIPAGTSASELIVQGFVALDSADSGVDGSGNPTTPAVASPSLIRGVASIKVVREGITLALLDQSGAGAAAIAQGTPCVASRATSGYAQGSATQALGQTAAVAWIPSVGLASTITAAALVQPSQTVTIATPAVGDIVNIVVQTPYSDSFPSVAQTTLFSYVLQPADVATAITAATAAVTAFNASSNLVAKYYKATNVNGTSAVITIATQGALYDAFLRPTNLFKVTFANGGGFLFSPSGSAANGLTISSSVTGAGGTTAVAGGGTLAGGTGFKGLLPVFVVCP